MNRIYLTALALMIAAGSFSGCKTMEFGGPNWFEQEDRPRFRNSIKFFQKQQSEIGTPHKMAVIWKDSTLKRPGTPIKRGFGGRIYFYDNENKPIKVDGEMVVYGFEEGSPNAEPKKFVFQQDKLDQHYGETDIGHSYSFWIPWDEAGGFRKSVALIPIFKPFEMVDGERVAGKIVKAGQTTNILPGPIANETQVVTTGKKSDVRLTSGGSDESSGVVQAGGITSESNPSSGFRETTIRLPKHLADRVGKTVEDTGNYNAILMRKTSIEPDPIATDLRGQSREEVIQAQAEALANSRANARTRRSSSAVLDTQVERPAFGKPAPFK